jgi:hypothetical protein
MSFVVACALVVATGTGSPRDAHAATVEREASGELGGGTLAVGIEVARGASPVPIDAGSRSLPRLFTYRWTPIPGGPLGSLEGLCNAGGTVLLVAEPVFGWLYRVQTFTRDGNLVSDALECVAFPDPNDISTPPPPPIPPAPPTIGDVWRAVPLPRPVVGANPISRGVTGLETRLWSGGGQTVQVAVTIGAFRVVGTASVVEYRFSTDEGVIGASLAPGSPSSPAAAYRFARKGSHALSVSSVWRATVTLIGPGGVAPVPIDLDTAVLTATVAYPVVEVRSRLVG